MRGAPTQIPVRVEYATEAEISAERDSPLDQIFRHPCRQARFSFWTMLRCKQHKVAVKTTRRCEHCRAHDSQILAFNVLRERRPELVKAMIESIPEPFRGRVGEAKGKRR